MIIKIIHRGDQKDKVYNQVHTRADLLLSHLWSEPEPNHNNWRYNDDASITMLPEQAKQILQNSLKKQKAGNISLSLKKIKHQGLKRRLGLTLLGEYDGTNVNWKEAQIDQQTFLKYRPSKRPGIVLPILIAKSNRENMQHQIHEAQKNQNQLDAENFVDELDPRFDLKRRLSLNSKRHGIQTHENPDSNKQGRFNGFKIVLKHPLFQALVIGGLTASVTSVAGLSTMLIAGLSVGLAAITFGIGYFIGWRKEQYEQSYQEVAKMKTQELKGLEPSFKSAFQKGLQADSWGNWSKSIFDTQAWKQYRAFGAGLKAKEHQDTELGKRLQPAL